MVQSCPGFATYENLNSGQVLVNGQLPVWVEAARIDPLVAAWEKYGAALQSASKRYDIPVAWLVGIMMAESKGNAKACSSCSICKESLCETAAGLSCCAFGLMQMIGPTARAYGTTPADILTNPVKAIDAACELIVDLEEKHGRDLPRIAAAYNGGIKGCGKSGTTFGWNTNGDYPMIVVKYANTFVSLKLAPAKSAGGNLAWGLAAVGLVAAVWVYRS